MSAYLIWNPTIVEREPCRLEFVVTTSDASNIADGTDAFINEMLRDIDVDQPARRWTLTPYRSMYFSEYLNEGWEDRWMVVWRARVDLDAIPFKVKIGKFGWIHTNADDASWTIEKDRLNLQSARCLVVADFANDGALERARNVVAAARQRREITGSLDFSRSEAFGIYPQLQIDMGEFPSAFYEAGAVDAEKLIALLEKMGGSTNHLATLKRHESQS